MGDHYPTVRLAAAQASPVFLDREQSTDKAVALIAEAAQQKGPGGTVGLLYRPDR